MLRRILRRLCAANFARCPLEIVFGDLQIMLESNALAVADPGADDVQGVRRGQLGFP
jgi:hypothetical protein